MSNKSWLQLTDYSAKYDISISTLRRRIKEESIEFKLDSGKYYLLDEGLNKKPRGRKPAEDKAETQKEDFFDHGSQIGSAVYFDSEDVIPVGGVLDASAGQKRNENIFVAANKLLEELKRAYSQILQEKEEQILQLKEEIADLRTLAQVLESENDRLRKKLNY